MLGIIQTICHNTYMRVHSHPYVRVCLYSCISMYVLLYIQTQIQFYCHTAYLAEFNKLGLYLCICNYIFYCYKGLGLIYSTYCAQSILVITYTHVHTETCACTLTHSHCLSIQKFNNDIVVQHMQQNLQKLFYFYRKMHIKIVIADI